VVGVGEAVGLVVGVTVGDDVGVCVGVGVMVEVGVGVGSGLSPPPPPELPPQPANGSKPIMAMQKNSNSSFFPCVNMFTPQIKFLIKYVYIYINMKYQFPKTIPALSVS
jgi:hypothetical protein